MDERYEKIAESAQALRQRLPAQPDVAVVLRDQLFDVLTQAEQSVCIAYADIPHFPQSTLSRDGRAVFTHLEGRSVLFLCGRFHTYEGFSMWEAAYPVMVLHALGVRRLILTNAAGAVNPAYHVGQIVAVADHLNMVQHSPDTGPNLPQLGERFFDMTNAYSPALRQAAQEAAKEIGLPLEEGVYAFMAGPQYETPAEIRMLRTLGADLVGMSTVPEVIEAAHCGMQTLALSLVSNMAAGVTGAPLSDAEVTREADAASKQIASLLRGVLRRLGNPSD